MDPTVELDHFAHLDTVLSRDGTFVFASAAVGSQGNKSPSSRYQNAFVKSEVAASLQYVNMVSKNER